MGQVDRGRDDSRFGWLAVTTGHHNSSLGVVPVTSGYQNFRIRVVTGYHWLPLFLSQSETLRMVIAYYW